MASLTELCVAILRYVGERLETPDPASETRYECPACACQELATNRGPCPECGWPRTFDARANDIDEDEADEASKDEGLDEEGLDEEGLDEEGLDEEGLDEEGLDEEGLDDEEAGEGLDEGLDEDRLALGGVKLWYCPACSAEWEVPATEADPPGDNGTLLSCSGNAPRLCRDCGAVRP